MHEGVARGARASCPPAGSGAYAHALAPRGGTRGRKVTVVSPTNKFRSTKRVFAHARAHAPKGKAMTHESLAGCRNRKLQLLVVSVDSPRGNRGIEPSAISRIHGEFFSRIPLPHIDKLLISRDEAIASSALPS